MRIFTELFIDELRILISDRDYEIDVEIVPAGSDSPDHPFVFATTNLAGYQLVYGIGQTPEQAIQELASNVITYYELAMIDIEEGFENCTPDYQEQLIWWTNHWCYQKIFVPDEMADMELSTHERWEEYSRRFERGHIKFLLTNE